MAASRSSERTAREFYETKQKAVQYYQSNQVPEKLEEILNSMFYENPDDVYGRLSEYFETLSKPSTISKLVSQQVYDSKGQPTLQTEVHCVVKGVDKHITTTTLCNATTLSDSAPVERKEADETERLQFVQAAIEYINGPINEKVKGLNPKDQKEIDTTICEIIQKLKEEHEEKERLLKEQQADQEPQQPQKETTKEDRTSPKARKKGSAKSATVVVEEPKEQLFTGSNALCLVSQSMVKTAALLNKIHLYEHIASLRYEQTPEKYRLPLPMASILSFGKAAACKLNMFKEVMIVPNPCKPMDEVIKQMFSIYNQVGKALFTKFGVVSKNVNDLGCYMPTYDKPEQALDLIQESMTHLGLTPGEDFNIVLNCAAHEMFDMDKGKYEITTGVFKGPDDMAEVYNDLLTRYPAIIAIIDPLKKQPDAEPWVKVIEKISEKCYILGDHLYPRTERFVNEGLGEYKSSAIVLKLQQMTTITDTINAVKFLCDEGLETVISTVQAESGESLLADLAVGIGAKFLKLGAPSRGERVALYNRLLQIGTVLKEKDALTQDEVHEFPNILPPPPPEPDPEEEGAAQAETENTDDKKKK